MFLLEEWVLWLHPWSLELHIDQLHQLIQTQRRPTMSVGIISVSAPRQGIHPTEAFDITDDELVSVELTSGYLSVTQPPEIDMYESQWEQLSSLAVFDHSSVAFIEHAIAMLEHQRHNQDRA